MQLIPHYMSVLHHGGKDKNFVEGDLGITSSIKVAIDVVIVKTLTNCEYS